MLCLRRSGILATSSIVAIVVLVVFHLMTNMKEHTKEAIWNAEINATTKAEAIWDAEINATTKAERCRCYGYSYDSNQKTHCGVFMGSLIADDLWGSLEASLAEAYGIYTLVMFVESNMTQALFTRKMQFLPGSDNR